MVAVGIAVIVLLAPGMVVATLRDAEELDTEDLFTPRVSTGKQCLACELGSCIAAIHLRKQGGTELRKLML